MVTVLVAKALIVDTQGKCLVLRRSETHPHSALKPDLPGGQLDDNELPAAAVCREIAEETGLQIQSSDARLVFATTDISHGKNYVRFLFVIEMQEAEPEIAISWEHADSQWLPFDKLTGYMENPEYLKGIAYIGKHHIIS